MKFKTKELSLPLIQGGMGIGVSLGGLAGAVAREGAMGVISTANPGYKDENFWTNPQKANMDALAFEIKKAKELSCGNGIVAINAMAAGNDYQLYLNVALENGVEAIISGAGLPLTLPGLCEGYEVLLAPIVSSGRAAVLICKTWLKRYNRLPDFIVLEGAGAGGHLGFSLQELTDKTYKSLDELFHEVREGVSQFGDIPIFVAGSVYSAKEVSDWIAKGAAGVQIATRFIATHECDAALGYKQAIMNCKKEDICIVKSPVGMPGRALRSPLIKILEKGERVAPKKCMSCLAPCKASVTPYCITNALMQAALGNWEEGLFFCGENANKLEKLVSVKELINDLMSEWRNI